MQDKFTIEQVKKALEQAEANLNFEEVDLKQLINNIENKQKTLRKETKNE